MNFVDKVTEANFSFTLATIRIRHVARCVRPDLSVDFQRYSITRQTKSPTWCERSTSLTKRVSFPLPLFTRLSQRPPLFFKFFYVKLFVFWCHRNKISQLSPAALHVFICEGQKKKSSLIRFHKKQHFSAAPRLVLKHLLQQENQKKVDLLICPHDANWCRLRNASVPNSDSLEVLLKKKHIFTYLSEYT